MAKNSLAAPGTDHSAWYLDVAHHGKCLNTLQWLDASLFFLNPSLGIQYDRKWVKKIVALEYGISCSRFWYLSCFSKKKKNTSKDLHPEFATVTHVGGKELPEHYAPRPTSETLLWFFKSSSRATRTSYALQSMGKYHPMEKGPVHSCVPVNFIGKKDTLCMQTEADAHEFHEYPSIMSISPPSENISP